MWLSRPRHLVTMAASAAAPAAPDNDNNSQWSRADIRLLIQSYRDRRCLWDVNLKNTAFGEIADIMRTSVNTVKCKIRTLRTTHRRELKRITMAKKSGKCYTSKVWYIDLLDFVMDPDEEEEEVRSKHLLLLALIIIALIIIGFYMGLYG